MSILDLLARGVQTSPLDVAKAGVRGTMDRSLLETASLDRQAKQMELDDFLLGRKSREVSRQAQVMKNEEFIADETYREQQRISAEAAAKDKRKLAWHEAQSKRLAAEGKAGYKSGKIGTVTKASIGQRKDATKLIENDKDIGGAAWNKVGFNSSDNETIANSVANRAHEIQTQAKYLNTSINYNQAQTIAKDEFKAMKGIVWGSDTTLGVPSGSKLVGAINYAPGLSQSLLDFLGLADPDATTEDDGFERKQINGVWHKRRISKGD